MRRYRPADHAPLPASGARIWDDRAVITDESPAVSPLGNLGTLSMRDMAMLPQGALGEAMRRIIPDTPVEPVAVAAFNSAI